MGGGEQSSKASMEKIVRLGEERSTLQIDEELLETETERSGGRKARHTPKFI